MSFSFGEQIEDHSLRVLRSLSSYHVYAANLIEKHYSSLKEVSARYPQLAYDERLVHDKRLIMKNQEFLNVILENHIDPNALSHNFDNVNTEYPKSLLKQFVREWSSMGRDEREQSYGLILQTLQDKFPDKSNRTGIHVLVPGAGLGRLPYEIVKLGIFPLMRVGFRCQGCEFSEYMLLGSDWILNRCSETFDIFPSILQRINVKAYSDIACGVTIPDEIPLLELQENTSSELFSMVAGDFLSCYHEESGSWDIIVTSYFIDTASNVLDYVENIHRLLKRGGLWINLGPLLYHFDGHPTEKSIELPLEEILTIAKLIGFSINDREMRFVKNYYCQLAASMMKTEYECAFFVANKN